jgi:hypothetical protein
VVLVDRRMACFTCSYAAVPALTFAGRGTVLDAELVGSRLYVFDAVMMGGDRAVAELDYAARLEAARHWLADSGAVELGFGDAMLVTVLLKPTFPARLARKVMRDPASFGVRERTDGIVLTPVRLPVQLYTAWRMFKVKPHHTIDFRLVLVPTRQLKAYAHPMLSIPESIAERMSGPILRNALDGGTGTGAATQPGPSGGAQRPNGGGSGSGGGMAPLLRFSRFGKAAPAAPAAPAAASAARAAPAAASAARAAPAAAPAAASAAASFGSASEARPSVESRKRGRTLPVSVGAYIPPEQLRAGGEDAAEAAAAAAAAASGPSSRVSWILRLEYSHGHEFPDATRQGIEYNGHRLVLRIVEDESLIWLLDEVERVWRGIQGDVMAMAMIVECRLDLNDGQAFRQRAGGEEVVHCNVWIERPRPDKHEPNNSLTITRTLTTILHGVTEADLAVLEAGPEEAV